MSEPDLDQQAEELRRQLRDGRTTSANASSFKGSGSGDFEERSTFQDTGRDIENAQPDDSEDGSKDHGVRSAQPGIKEIFRRFRPDGGRSGEGGVSSPQLSKNDNGQSAERTIGNLVTASPIPPRPDESSFQEQRKKTRRVRHEPVEEKPRKERSFPVSTKRLTAKEAEALYEPFKTALIDEIGYIDDYLNIRLRNMDMEEEEVWSNLDNDEEEQLCRILLKLGQKSETVATGVRMVIELHDYTALAAIIVPRSIKTARIMRKTTRKRQPKIVRMRQHAAADQ